LVGSVSPLQYRWRIRIFSPSPNAPNALSDVASRKKILQHFLPESGHWLSVSGCPVCATSGSRSILFDRPLVRPAALVTALMPMADKALGRRPNANGVALDLPLICTGVTAHGAKCTAANPARLTTRSMLCRYIDAALSYQFLEIFSCQSMQLASGTVGQVLINARIGKGRFGGFFGNPRNTMRPSVCLKSLAWFRYSRMCMVASSRMHSGKSVRH
jgi:hypothetical protein